MAKTPNPPAPPAAPAAVPVEVPRVTYTTTEGITTVINPPADKASAPAPTEETE